MSSDYLLLAPHTEDIVVQHPDDTSRLMPGSVVFSAPTAANIVRKTARKIERQISSVRTVVGSRFDDDDMPAVEGVVIMALDAQDVKKQAFRIYPIHTEAIVCIPQTELFTLDQVTMSGDDLVLDTDQPMTPGALVFARTPRGEAADMADLLESYTRETQESEAEENSMMTIGIPTESALRVLPFCFGKLISVDNHQSRARVLMLSG